MWASHCSGFSRCGVWALGCAGSAALWHVGYSWIRDWISVSCIGRWILYHWATRKAPKYLLIRESRRVCGFSSWGSSSKDDSNLKILSEIAIQTVKQLHGKFTVFSANRVAWKSPNLMTPPVSRLTHISLSPVQSGAWNSHSQSEPAPPHGRRAHSSSLSPNKVHRMPFHEMMLFVTQDDYLPKAISWFWERRIQNRIYMCVCIYTHTHINMCVCIYICVCVCVYIYKMCIYMCVCVYIYGFPGGAVVKNIKYFSIMNENNFLSQKNIYICICVWCMLSRSVMSDFFVIPWTEEPGGLQSSGVAKKVRHDWANELSPWTYISTYIFFKKETHFHSLQKWNNGSLSPCFHHQLKDIT